MSPVATSGFIQYAVALWHAKQTMILRMLNVGPPVSIIRTARRRLETLGVRVTLIVLQAVCRVELVDRWLIACHFCGEQTGGSPEQIVSRQGPKSANCQPMNYWARSTFVEKQVYCSTDGE